MKITIDILKQNIFMKQQYKGINDHNNSCKLNKKKNWKELTQISQP